MVQFALSERHFHKIEHLSVPINCFSLLFQTILKDEVRVIETRTFHKATLLMDFVHEL